jgi:tRNA threonylcarbamoyl adenosine modification protein (Sua5/YciO/YrdC/YwlC family)
VSSSRAQGIAAATTAVGRGRVALVPTESVYALLADAFSARGVAAVRGAKNRSDSRALPVAVSSVSMLRGIAERLPSYGQTLVEAFWPGQLTLICHQQPSLAWAAGGDGRTLTVRMPLHPVALEVIAGVGPSVLVGADPPVDVDASGPPPDEVDIVLEAGSRPAELARSTVVDVRGPAPVVVREGALPTPALAKVAPTVVAPTEGERP